MQRLDWDDLGVLLAVAREGSLRLAAERLKLSAATASRRLGRLETHLGEVLVERAEDGCVLTPFGDEVVAWAKAMEHSAHAIERLRETQHSDNLGGVVRINADEWHAAFIAARTAGFHRRFPNVELEILASQRPFSLARREADLAIRKRLPEDGQLRVRRVGSIAFGLYASDSYLGDRGSSFSGETLAKLDFVSFEEAPPSTPIADWMHSLVGARPPRLRCNHVMGVRDGILAGAGAGVLAHCIGDALTTARCLLPRIQGLDEEIWVVMHDALTGSARVKVVGDFLSELFRREAHLLRGVVAATPERIKALQPAGKA